MTASKTPRVTVTQFGRVRVVQLDNPPVNALSHQARHELHEALAASIAADDVVGIVLASTGKNFISGADVSEFGTPKQFEAPRLIDLCALVDSSTKPFVAAIQGAALGGGLELALACHYRIAQVGAKFGLPEVKLGLIPGAGGTVRLPRLLGPVRALEMISAGLAIGLDEAIGAGLIDAAADHDLVAEAVELLRKVGIDGATTSKALIRNRRDRVSTTRSDPSSFEKLASEVAARARGQAAPLAVIEATRNAFTLPFEDALARERGAFLRLAASPESKALRHVFFAEREAAKLPDIGKDVTARPVAHVGVVGAGTMGGGIAMAFANAGLSVDLLELSADALQRGLQAIERGYQTSVTRGSLSAVEMNRRQSRIRGTTDYQALSACDLIVEAVFEDLAVKTEVFRSIDKVARDGAILATNTSYLDVNAIVAATRRPHDVVGLHFFSPANVMKLLEIVRTEATSPDVIRTAVETAKRIGKTPVVVGVCHGFVGNRMLAARAAENELLLMEGATPAQIDRVFTDFGWPMGPFQMGDLAGLDIGWRNRKAQGKVAPIADALCERGHFGQKTGAGWYIYEAGSRTPRPNPLLDEIIAEKATEFGMRGRTVGDDEILERTHYPLVNEGAKILNEGIAIRASDIDVVWISGYGFPSSHGGPIYWAREDVGLQRISERLDYWFEKTGREVFRKVEFAEF